MEASPRPVCVWLACSDWRFGALPGNESSTWKWLHCRDTLFPPGIDLRSLAGRAGEGKENDLSVESPWLLSKISLNYWIVWRSLDFVSKSYLFLKTSRDLCTKLHFWFWRWEGIGGDAIFSCYTIQVIEWPEVYGCGGGVEVVCLFVGLAKTNMWRSLVVNSASDSPLSSSVRSGGVECFDFWFWINF